MKQLKKALTISLFMLPGILLAQEIFIPNSSFEENNTGQPAGWVGNIWDISDEAYYLRVESGGAYAGENYLVLENRVENHTMAKTVVAVEPGYYLFSAMVKTENIEDKPVGAHLGIEGYWERSEALTGTVPDWTPLRLSLRVHPGMESLTLVLQLGGFAALNKGKACFDQVRLIRTTGHTEGVPILEAVPPGKEEKTPAAQAEDNQESTITSGQQKKGMAGWLIMLPIIAAAALIGFLVVKKKDKETGSGQPPA